jgi:hypothetical protein
LNKLIQNIAQTRFTLSKQQKKTKIETKA